MTSILKSSERERRISAALRRIAIDRLRQVSPEQAAQKLGILPRGVEVLLWQREWPLETAFRVSEALGLDIAKRVEVALEEVSEPQASRQSSDLLPAEAS